jgi:HD-GYP domain-containing protein (c-di-GMP phosphodiesterase class II)
VANNFLSQVECEPWQERALEFKLASAMAIPFSVSTKAVLTIYSHNTQAFDDVLVDGLREIVHRVETTSALYRSLDETRHSLDGTIKALALMAEVRDPYTEGHQHRAGELASAIATYLHVDEALIHLIEMSGQVHDIGKVAVPAEMLTRPGRLSSLEFEMVKQHCLVGHQILQSASLPWPLPEVALQHHERLDGSGYPYGLTGDEIRLPARIVAVADVVEAMTNDRPYRAALGLEQALAEISAGRGTRFDAEVVDACIAVFERGYRFDPSSVFGPLQTD